MELSGSEAPDAVDLEGFARDVLEEVGGALLFEELWIAISTEYFEVDPALLARAIRGRFWIDDTGVVHLEPPSPVTAALFDGWGAEGWEPFEVAFWETAAERPALTAFIPGLDEESSLWVDVTLDRELLDDEEEPW